MRKQEIVIFQAPPAISCVMEEFPPGCLSIYVRYLVKLRPGLNANSALPAGKPVFS